MCSRLALAGIISLISGTLFPVLAGTAPIALETAHIQAHDQASLMRGALFFKENCMSCHSMKYLEYNPLAQKAGITLDKMPLQNTKWWLGIAPPDLSLIVRQRGANWVLTYLHSFYQDQSRPTGYNNLLVDRSNMMNVLAPYQGEQRLTAAGLQHLAANNHHHATWPIVQRSPSYYQLLERVKAGSMTPEQFDNTMVDLVNFLAYASEPEKSDRERLGIWVLLFLAVLFVLSVLLKRSYWK